MDILWDKKLVFVSSYSDAQTGIYSYPLPENFTEFHRGMGPSASRPKRAAQGDPTNGRNSMKRINVSIKTKIRKSSIA